jgi:hypothetical protein
MGSRSAGGFLFVERPFFDVDVELYAPELGDMSDRMWGAAKKTWVDDLVSVLKKFGNGIDKAVTGLRSGVKLQKPDPKIAVGSAEGAEHFGPVLTYWCTEQLKTNDCKIVLHGATTAKAGSIKKWKTLKDNQITDAANEAKDNVKYLTALEKYVEPLYSGNTQAIIDGLPALMNNVKMMHTIARYYNTTERMTGLFAKITNQMITNCKEQIMNSNEYMNIWDQPVEELLKNLDGALSLNDHYQEQYRLTKAKLETQTKGNQFDFSENHIFGKFELFCKRIQKLIDMFNTVRQFTALATHNLDGMESLIVNFFKIVSDFKQKKYELLDFSKNQFDRDYLEFNVSIHELEMRYKAIPMVAMNPSLDEIQDAIDRTALYILKCSKKLYAWGTNRLALYKNEEGEGEEKATYHDLIGREPEIVKNVLLLTGAVELGTEQQVMDYLTSFREWDWLWKNDMDSEYTTFLKTKPILEDFEKKLKYYMSVEADIMKITGNLHNLHQSGAPVLSLETEPLKHSLKASAATWKTRYASNLHGKTKQELEDLTAYIAATKKQVSRPVNDLEDVRAVMTTLKEIREKESEIDLQFGPVEDMYALLSKYEVRVTLDGADDADKASRSSSTVHGASGHVKGAEGADLGADVNSQVPRQNHIFVKMPHGTVTLQLPWRVPRHLDDKQLGDDTTLKESGLPALVEVKAQLSDRFGIPVPEQRLLLMGKQLDDDFVVGHESTLHLMLRIRGGMDDATMANDSGESFPDVRDHDGPSHADASKPKRTNGSLAAMEGPLLSNRYDIGTNTPRGFCLWSLLEQ